ncbi:MAG: MarR family transcriptional regulator [Alphaproteobacteria bacterium]|nr:MarR family transcriptional regulator [Alphaproteobacteria bacterium]
MNKNQPAQQFTHSDLILENNAIGSIWQICFVANSFVFPIYAFYDKQYKISRMEFVILFILAHKGKLMAWEMCIMTGLPKNNISRGVKKLESKGLIKRSQDPKDARRAILVTTKTGEGLYQELIVHYTRRADDFLSLLDEDDKNDLDRIMLKLSKSMPTIS